MYCTCERVQTVTKATKGFNATVVFYCHGPRGDMSG